MGAGAFQEAMMEDIRNSNLNVLLAEAKALSANRIVMQSQEGAHLVNLLCRVIETIVDGAPKTKPISTHHS